DAIAAELRSLVDYHNCRVFVVDRDELTPVAFLGDLTSGMDAHSLDVLRKRVGEGVTGRCAALGESIVVADAANCEFGQLIEGTDPIEVWLLAAPVRYGSRVVGVIVVSKLGLDQFDEDDVRLLEVLAGHAAVAVENASLYEAARREAESATALLEFGRELATLVERDEIVERVTSLGAEILGCNQTSIYLERDGALRLEAETGHPPELTAELAKRKHPVEANDEYTSRHARWICDLSLRVGEALGLDERTLKRLELGALLHDIGKIGIPSDILSKPGRLTAAEKKLVQTHPELGERIIAPIDRLQVVRPIVRHCHERWDGHGYPDGVAGEDIPLESRIIFVCDAYHAMTTDRPYRRQLSHRETLRRLAEGSGTQFDPNVVGIALRVLEKPAHETEPSAGEVSDP